MQRVPQQLLDLRSQLGQPICAGMRRPNHCDGCGRLAVPAELHGPTGLYSAAPPKTERTTLGAFP